MSSPLARTCDRVDPFPDGDHWVPGADPDQLGTAGPPLRDGAEYRLLADDGQVCAAGAGERIGPVSRWGPRACWSGVGGGAPVVPWLVAHHWASGLIASVAGRVGRSWSARAATLTCLICR